MTSYPSTELRTFATALAGRLPGDWSVQAHTLTDHPSNLADQVWDLGILQGALSVYAVQEAAVLTSPDGTRLVAVHRPRTHDQVLVGALRPTSIPAELMDLHGGDAVPLAIAVDAAPVRASAEVRRRFLPRYQQAAWDVRVRALRAAADGITEASAAWDAVSDSLCDEHGWPLDDLAYEAGKIARDALAWQHVETFLALGPDLLVNVRRMAQPADYVTGPLSDNLRAVSGIDITLARAAHVREEWEQVVALMDAIMPGLTPTDAAEAEIARNEDGWSYATELTRNGRALADAAEKLTSRVGATRSADDARAPAAPARSRPANRAAMPAPTAPQPPPAPSTPRLRHRR